MTVAAPPESPPTPAATAAEPPRAEVRAGRLVRRLSRWRSMGRRDTATFARRWPGKLLVAIVLVTIPCAMTLKSLTTGRWIDNSWTVLAMTALLAVGYLASRRLLPTVLVAIVAVLLASWVLAPRLASTRSGDAGLLSQLEADRDMGMLGGFHDLAVAEIDLDAAHPVRLAGLGARADTPMEVGSLTKAMTGLVIADAVRRGELRMDVPVSTYLPDLAGSPAGTVTMRELGTHHAGYADFGPGALHRAAWTAPLGGSFLGAHQPQLTTETRAGSLETRDSYVYSSLGAAAAGRAVAAAAGMSYPELMRTRLFAPLGMTRTAIQTRDPLVSGGSSESGLPVRAWTFDAYAPAGAVVSTARDLAKLATALLKDTAPGMAALRPTAATDQGNTRIGIFWQSSTWQTGQTIVWHNGQTGGYSSYLGLDRRNARAVLVLSDVATEATTDFGVELLAQRH